MNIPYKAAKNLYLCPLKAQFIMDKTDIKYAVPNKLHIEKDRTTNVLNENQGKKISSILNDKTDISSSSSAQEKNTYIKGINYLVDKFPSLKLQIINLITSRKISLDVQNKTKTNIIMLDNSITKYPEQTYHFISADIFNTFPELKEIKIILFMKKRILTIKRPQPTELNLRLNDLDRHLSYIKNSKKQPGMGVVGDHCSTCRYQFFCPYITASASVTAINIIENFIRITNTISRITSFPELCTNLCNVFINYLRTDFISCFSSNIVGEPNFQYHRLRAFEGECLDLTEPPIHKKYLVMGSGQIDQKDFNKYYETSYFKVDCEYAYKYIIQVAENFSVSFVLYYKDKTKIPSYLIMLLNSIKPILFQAYYNSLIRINASIDTLTQLYIRGYFIEAVQSIIQYNPYVKSTGILMIDIDHFKKINDTLGHAVGDDTLIKVSKTIKCQLREKDLICRWGGEEILIFCPNVDDCKILLEIAERIRTSVSKIHVGVNNQSVTVSIGGIWLNLDNDIKKQWQKLFQDHLIVLADNNLYKAKETGRNKSIITAIEYQQSNQQDLSSEKCLQKNNN